MKFKVSYKIPTGKPMPTLTVEGSNEIEAAYNYIVEAKVYGVEQMPTLDEFAQQWDHRKGLFTVTPAE